MPHPTQLHNKKQNAQPRPQWLFALCIYAGIVIFGWPAQAENTRLLVLGDSLVAGLGLHTQDAFPTQLERQLIDSGENVTVINAGVPGDTSHAALRRLNWVLHENVDAAIIELGGNDALQGLSPARTHQALEEIILRLQGKSISILLAGMHAPPNMGQRYSKAFDAIFPALAEKYDVIYYPFFLEGVYGDSALMFDDGIHPNAAGVRAIVKRILPDVKLLLAQVRTTP